MDARRPSLATGLRGATCLPGLSPKTSDDRDRPGYNRGPMTRREWLAALGGVSALLGGLLPPARAVASGRAARTALIGVPVAHKDLFRTRRVRSIEATLEAHRLPVGLQLAGQPCREPTLLAAATVVARLSRA